VQFAYRIPGSTGTYNTSTVFGLNLSSPAYGINTVIALKANTGNVNVTISSPATGSGTAYNPILPDVTVTIASAATGSGTANTPAITTTGMVTCKWANILNGNVSAVTTDTTNVSDTTNNTAPYDTTTYVQSTGAATQYLTIIWDLGSPSTVTSLRYNFYYVESPNMTVRASNDGTTWVDPNTGAAPALMDHMGTGSWEYSSLSNITSTQYRYWRVSLTDSHSSYTNDCRCGDFRLYNGSTQYVITVVASKITGISSITGVSSITF
jgi:hypothetical protein